MCHFITGIFSGKTSLEEINAVGKEFGLQFEDCKNEFIQKQLKHDETYLLKCCKQCDCGTPLGSQNPQKINPAENIGTSEIEKLRRKGWSETKIQRFLSDKNKNTEKYIRGSEQSKAAAENELQEWVAFYRKLFESTDIKTFGILLHWYSGSIESERITIKKRVLISRSELTIKHLLEVEEDTLYIIM